MSNRGKIVKKSATVKVPMIARGPVFRPIVVDALHNPSNLRDRDPDPEEDQRSSQNGQTAKVLAKRSLLCPSTSSLRSQC